jgi:hypothetical protein
MNLRFEDLLERLELRRNQKEYSRGLAAHGILYSDMFRRFRNILKRWQSPAYGGNISYVLQIIKKRSFYNFDTCDI